MTGLQKKILDLAAQGLSTADIAGACRCSVGTVRRVRASAELNRERNQAGKKEISRDVTESLAKAAKELDRILSDSNERTEMKLQAAKLILELGNRKNADEPKEDIHIRVEYV